MLVGKLRQRQAGALEHPKPQFIQTSFYIGVGNCHSPHETDSVFSNSSRVDGKSSFCIYILRSGSFPSCLESPFPLISIQTECFQGGNGNDNGKSPLPSRYSAAQLPRPSPCFMIVRLEHTTHTSCKQYTHLRPP